MVCIVGNNKIKMTGPNELSQVKGFLFFIFIFFQPQTDAWTPNEFFEPQTPLLLPHPKLTELELDSLVPGAEVDGLEADEVDRSLPEVPVLALSLGANP